MKQFIKANIAAIVATAFDFCIAFICAQYLKTDKVVANVLGTIAGGILNFLLGRYWAFDAAGLPLIRLSTRYMITWSGNFLLNAIGNYVLIKLVGLHYILAKVIIAVSVAFGYNYPMQKNYVFRNIKKNENTI
jgi:putative flippase GtrA